MQAKELFERMTDLYTKYKEAMSEHNLGRAGIVRDEAAQLLSIEWEQVNSALERYAFPLSHGAQPEPGDCDEDASERRRA